MSQRQTPFGHHLDQIAQAELVAQVPANTHRMMISRSKWRPPNNSSRLFSLLIAGYPNRFADFICTRAAWTANAVNNYQRMPHILTMNPVKQMVPLQQPPDAIINGHATGYLWDGISREAKFAPPRRFDLRSSSAAEGKKDGKNSTWMMVVSPACV
ncbi:hypothetical protein [Paraburkholderia sp. FT54]|uniref:hypothetical protein n=1 Tax=Paraburkholderia sp. FT54 TaxID=3074437 RepID=UPI0038F67834